MAKPAAETLAAFDFNLPEERIALHPANPRGSARLLVIGADGRLQDCHISDLPQFLNKGDCLLMNNSRVIPARLEAVAENGKRIELVLIEAQATGGKALARPARHLTAGNKLSFTSDISATITAKHGGEIAFTLVGATSKTLLAKCGAPPLPPYILKRRALERDDKEAYQTIYADPPGSVAAPTAGLHITSELLACLEKQGIKQAFLTLHVGAGTFLPVRSENPAEHVMHGERGVLTQSVASTLNEAHAAGKRVCCVGTTSLRLLETAADSKGQVQAFDGVSDLFILPGYKFRAADMLLTNFHLPRSTLFMLVAAFCGQTRIHKAYHHAIDRFYRFYSYGDACLMFRQKAAQ